MSEQETLPDIVLVDEQRVNSLLAGAVEPIEESLELLRKQIETVAFEFDSAASNQVNLELSAYEPTLRYRFGKSGQSLGVNTPCYIKPSDGKMYRYNAKLPIEWYCGVTTRDYTFGEDSVSIIEGEFTLNKNFTASKNVYVNTSGKLTQRAGGKNICIGTMKTGRNIVLQIPTGDTGDKIALLDTDRSHLMDVTWAEDDSDNRIWNILLDGADRSLTMEADAIISQDYTDDSATVQFAALALAQTADDNALNISGYDDNSGDLLKAYIGSGGGAYIEATTTDAMHFLTKSNRFFFFETDVVDNIFLRPVVDWTKAALLNPLDSDGKSLGYIRFYGSNAGASSQEVRIVTQNNGDLKLYRDISGTPKLRMEIDGTAIDFFAPDATAMFSANIGGLNTRHSDPCFFATDTNVNLAWEVRGTGDFHWYFYGAVTTTAKMSLLGSEGILKIDCIGELSPNNEVIFKDYARADTDTYRRYYHSTLGSFDPAASGATFTEPNANTIGGYRLNATAEDLFVSFDVHTDWSATTDAYFEICFEVNVDNTGGATTDTVDIKGMVYMKSETETATKSQTIEEAITVGKSAQYRMFKKTFAIDYDDGSNPIEAGDLVTIKINLETDTSEVDDIVVNAITYYYPTTHMGIEAGDT